MSRVKACDNVCDAYGNPQKHDFFESHPVVWHCKRCKISIVDAYEAERYDHQELRQEIQAACESLGIMAAEPIKAIRQYGIEQHRHHLVHHRYERAIVLRLRMMLNEMKLTNAASVAFTIAEESFKVIERGHIEREEDEAMPSADAKSLEQENYARLDQHEERLRQLENKFHDMEVRGTWRR